jgi:hypothetical protein
MTKTILVVMTMLLSTSAYAQDNHLDKVQLQTASHKWEIDVKCQTDLQPNERVKVKTHPTQIRLDGRITIEQKKKRQSCRVRQLVAKLN